MFKSPALALFLSLGLAACTSPKHPVTQSSVTNSAPVAVTKSPPAPEFLIHSFKKVQITDQFWSEGANFGDFNHDGQMDIVSGPYWYEGPDFKKRHEYYPADKSFMRKKADGTEESFPGFEGALGIKNAHRWIIFSPSSMISTATGGRTF